MTKKGLYQPPQMAIKLFRWYCRADRREELEGDLEEFFYLRKEHGEPLWKAQLFFWWNVLRCYKSYSKTKTQKTMTFYPLFKSYFKLAIRHSWKNKWSVLINIIGLGMALSMCIFVYSIFAYNIEFDTFYQDIDDVYRVHSMTFENGRERRNELSPGPLDFVLRNEISSVSQVASFLDESATIQINTDYFEERLGVVSSDFFEMFDTPLWYGSYASFGDQPSIYLSKEAAKRFFGNKVALDEKLTLFLSSATKLELTVAGVFERTPTNTSFDVSMVISEETYLQARERDKDDWNSLYYVSHFLRTNPENIPDIEKHLSQYLSQQNESHKTMKFSEFDLVPFLSPIQNQNDVYRSNSNRRLSPEPLIIFTVLATMIFLVACFNLANSSIAMIANRLKEIGIRKTLGSENHKILIQFLIEMGIVCCLSLIIGLSMVNAVSGFILGLFGASFPIQDVQLDGILIFLILFLLFTTLIAGLMPALYAWKFQPIAIMRKSVKLRGVGWINKTLTVAQYTFSIAVLSAAISFSNNAQFLEDLDPGYADDDIYVLEFDNKDYYIPVKEKVDQLAGVTTTGTHNHIQIMWMSGRTKLLEIDTSSYELKTFSVDESYLDLMEIPIINGRSFIQDSEAEANKSIIINQEFVKRYYAGNDPMGKSVKIAGIDKTIVGVIPNLIQDVYYDAEDRPYAFIPRKDDKYRYLVVKVESGDRRVFEDNVKQIWSESVEMPFQGSWQKDLAFGTAVKDSENLKLIFFWMAVLGCLLSIAGIFSLSKLNIAKKIKEISIRKVLGSSVKQLLLTINKPFIIILMISVIIGSTFGFLVSDGVLSMLYLYYQSVSPTTSLLIGLTIGLTAVLIITVSIISPARANPVSGLRQE